MLYCKRLITGFLYVAAVLMVTAETASAQHSSGELFFDNYGRLIRAINDNAKTTDMRTLNSIIPADPARVTEFKKIAASLPRPLKSKKSAERIFRDSRKSVLSIGYYYYCDQCPELHATIVATAVVLNEDGLCITSQHVLESLLGLGKPASDSAPRPKNIFVADAEGNIYPVHELLSYSKAGDIALFTIGTGGKRMFPISLGPTTPVGAKVYVLAHAHGDKRMYYFSQGGVARNAIYDDTMKDSERMEITADYAAGSSGGPVIDENGNLVGIVCSTVSLHTFDPKAPLLQMVVKETTPVCVIKRLFN